MPHADVDSPSFKKSRYPEKPQVLSLERFCDARQDIVEQLISSDSTGYDRKRLVYTGR